MSKFDESFVASELPESSGEFPPLPDGWYSVIINKAEIKSTKEGSGQYINLRYDITGPTNQGRIVFSNINIKNKSSVAEEIGRQALGGIMRAIGLSKVDDTDQLIGGNLEIKLSTRTQEGYEPSNEVRSYRAVGDQQSSSPALSTGASSKAAPPWAKK